MIIAATETAAAAAVAINRTSSPASTAEGRKVSSMTATVTPVA